MRQLPHGLAILLLGLAALSAPASDPPTMQVAVIPLLLPAPGRPYPVFVKLVCEQDDGFAGSLQARLGDDRGFTAQHPVAVGRGTFVYQLFPFGGRQGLSPLRVTLLDQEGKTMAETELTPPTPAADRGDWLVADLRAASTPITPLDLVPALAGLRVRPDTAISLGGSPLNTNSLESVTGAMPRQAWKQWLVDHADNLLAVKAVDGATVSRLSGSHRLLQRWYGYRAFDVVVWNFPPPAIELAEQRQALAQWVRQGGRLIVMTPPGEAPAVPFPLPTAAALAPGQVLPVGLGTILFHDVEAPLPESREGLLKLLGAPPDRHYRLADIQQMAQQEDLPTVPPKDQELSTLYSLVRLELDASPFGRSTAYRSGPDHLKQYMARHNGYVDIPVNKIWISGLIYVVIVSLLDFLLLGRRRRHWTWWTWPLWILLGGVLFYSQFYVRGSGQPKVLSWSIEDIDASTGQARRLELICHRQMTTRSQLPIASEDAWATAHILGEVTRIQGTTRSDHTQDSIVLNDLFGAFSFHVREQATTTAEPQFQLSWDDRTGPPRVKTLSEHTYTGGLLMIGRQVYPLTAELLPLTPLPYGNFYDMRYVPWRDDTGWYLSQYLHAALIRQHRGERLYPFDFLLGLPVSSVLADDRALIVAGYLRDDGTPVVVRQITPITQQKTP